MRRKCFKTDMEIASGYFPHSVFAPAGPSGAPRVFIAPQRYVQGRGALADIGRYLSLVRARRVAILISAVAVSLSRPPIGQ